MQQTKHIQDKNTKIQPIHTTYTTNTTHTIHVTHNTHKLQKITYTYTDKNIDKYSHTVT